MRFAGIPILLLTGALSACHQPADCPPGTDDTGGPVEDVPVVFGSFTTTAQPWQGYLYYQLDDNPSEPEELYCPWAYGAFMHEPAALPWVELDTCAMASESDTNNLRGEVDVGRSIPLVIGGDTLTMTRETEFEEDQVIYWYEPWDTYCERGREPCTPLTLDGAESDVWVPDGSGGFDLAPLLMEANQTGTLVLDWQPSERGGQQIYLGLVFSLEKGYGTGVGCALRDDGHAEIVFGDGPLGWLHVMTHIGRRQYGSLTHPELGNIQVEALWQVGYRSWDDVGWVGAGE